MPWPFAVWDAWAISLSKGFLRAFGTFFAMAGALVLLSLLPHSRWTFLIAMTGFVAGPSLLILTGELGVLTGYAPSGANKLLKTVDHLLHVGQWDPATTVVGFGTIIAMIVFKKIPVTEKAAAVITLVLASVVVNLLRLPSVELVRDIAKIPSGLSTVMLPDPAMMPRLARGSLSVALVALTQGAGIGTALPNPDGSRANQSRDFIGQGVGNLVGSFFQSLATGGVSVAHRHQCARRRQNPYGRSLFGFVADSDRGPDGQSGGSCSVKRDRRYSGGCSYGIDLGPDSRRPSDLENVKRIGCHGTSDLWLGALYPPSVHDFFRGRAVHDPLHLCVRYGARRRSRGHRRR